MKIFGVFFLILMIGGLIITGVQAAEININPNLPGSSLADQMNPNPAGLVRNFYEFALMMGGLLAFVIIIFAAIRYTVASDNPSKQSDAKDQILQALLGLLLLAGAFLILNTINPRLTELKLPSLRNIQETRPNFPNNLQAVPMDEGGECVQGQCNSGLMCSPGNTCTEPGECFAQEDCTQNYRCSIGGSVPGRCVSNNPGNAGGTCNPDCSVVCAPNGGQCTNGQCTCT